MPSNINIVIKSNLYDLVLKRIQRNAHLRLAAFGNRLQGDWKLRVHVVTGEFRDSIKFEMIDDGTGVLSSNVPQALIEEIGSRYRAAHPTLLPLMSENRRAFFELFRDLAG